MNRLLDRRVRVLGALGLAALTFALAMPRLDRDSCFLLAWDVGILRGQCN